MCSDRAWRSPVETAVRGTNKLGVFLLAVRLAEPEGNNQLFIPLLQAIVALLDTGSAGIAPADPGSRPYNVYNPPDHR